jgi:HSP20 family protein
MFTDVDPGSWEPGAAHPRVSFDDQGSAFVVRAEVPGVAEKDIELSATATTLTLKGQRKVEAPKGYSTHRTERNSWSFARTFELPAKVDAERVEARLENGVLTVTLPKAPEAQPKQIAVKAG